MFNLGFTMEELMFPENYQSNFLFNIESDCLIDKLNGISSTYENQEQAMIEEEDDDDDDWFTVKQLNPDMSFNNNGNLVSDQTLPLLNIDSDNYHLGQVKSTIELDDTIMAFLLPNISIKIARDKNNSSLSLSDTIPINSSSPSCDHHLLLNTAPSIVQLQSNQHLMSKSTSSLSFSTQSSTSLTGSSPDVMSPYSNDFSETAISHHSTDSTQKLSHHHHHHHHPRNSHSISDDSANFSGGRRRRKRTIFSAADIEYLKEAFIQNPKPSQQDISLLSEQLGHDSYVIRVWFYNKRQASKKRYN